MIAHRNDSIISTIAFFRWDYKMFTEFELSSYKLCGHDMFKEVKEESVIKPVWTDAEINALTLGHNLLGNSWKQILENYREIFNECRTGPDLRKQHLKQERIVIS